MFQQLRNQAERVNAALDPYLLMLALSKDKEFTDLIIKLNTESQLYDQGIDSEGKSLSDIGGGYSPRTIEIKQEEGQPTDRVTLKDTGEFYRSFRVTFIDGDLLIHANPYKGDVNLYREWGLNIVGLTQDNLDLVITVAQKKCIEIIRNNLKLAA